MRASVAAGFDLRWLRVDKQTHAQADSLQSLRRLANLFSMRNDVQTTFGGELLPLLRHEASVIGTHVFSKTEHRWSHGHFQIELGLQALAQELHITLLNMA